MKSNPFATLAYGAMTLLVAVYIAFVALLMHHDAMPIPVFAGIAFAALAALLLGAKACRTVKLDVAERADRPNRRMFLLAAGFSALVYAVCLIGFGAVTPAELKSVLRREPGAPTTTGGLD